MRGLRFLLGAAFLAALPLPALADSPVTSTPFSDAYDDIPLVRQAKKLGVMNKETAAFLAGPAPIDEKAAVVNALSWDIAGKRNAVLYAQLALGKRARDLKPADLAGDDAFVFGYLVLLDDYFTPGRAIPFLDEAVKRRPNSLTVAAIAGIAQSQDGMQDFCAVWKRFDAATSGAKEKDLRPDAWKIITDYLGMYRDDCRDDLPPAKENVRDDLPAPLHPPSR